MYQFVPFPGNHFTSGGSDLVSEGSSVSGRLVLSLSSVCNFICSPSTGDNCFIWKLSCHNSALYNHQAQRSAPWPCRDWLRKHYITIKEWTGLLSGSLIFVPYIKCILYFRSRLCRSSIFIWRTQSSSSLAARVSLLMLGLSSEDIYQCKRTCIAWLWQILGTGEKINWSEKECLIRNLWISVVALKYCITVPKSDIKTSTICMHPHWKNHDPQDEHKFDISHWKELIAVGQKTI